MELITHPAYTLQSWSVEVSNTLPIRRHMLTVHCSFDIDVSGLPRTSAGISSPPPAQVSTLCTLRGFDDSFGRRGGWNHDVTSVR